MRKRYCFEVSQQIFTPVEVTASSYQEAQQKVWQMINQNILLFQPQEPFYDIDLVESLPIPDLDYAIKLIEDYYKAEFNDGSSVDRSNLSHVSLAFTTFEDEPRVFGDSAEHQVQASVDLVSPAIFFCVDGKEIHRDTFSSFEKLIEAELLFLDFGELTTRYPE